MRASYCFLVFWLVSTTTVLAADPSGDPLWADRSVLEPLNRTTPGWVRFGGEFRLRYERQDNIGFRDGADDGYLLYRLRLNLQVQPRPWLTLFAEGQDARVGWNQRVPNAPSYQDTFDLRQAFVQLGSESQPLSVRVGRQELAFGEERLVGASNWANTSRTFDAVRLDLRSRNARVTAFTSSVVVTRDGEFNHHTQGNNLHGVWSSFERLIPKARVEPFFLWRLAPRVRAESGSFGKLDERIAGVRISGSITTRLAYVTEMVLQRGDSAGDSISAWAGHWRIEQGLPGQWSPKLRVESDYASGDSNPADGRLGTFDVLYPTPHDKYGLADQVGWRNVQHLGTTFEVRPKAKFAVQAKFHTWWLASARDGLYSAPGVLLVRDPLGRSGRHVGEEVDGEALWTPGKRVLFGAGVGHLFPGGFLKNASPGRGYTSLYLVGTYRF